MPFLGAGEVFQVSEGREGVVVREILQSGELILPLRNGEIVPSKPILFHWLGAATAKLTGNYQEFELRFPSAVAALIILLLPILLLRGLLPPSTLLLSSLLLLAMSGFYQLAADGRVDMVFNAFVVAIILVWLRAHVLAQTQRQPEQQRYLLLGLLAGGAVLTKGPLGIVLPGLVIFSISFIEARWEGVRRLFYPSWLVSVAACLAISAPWYYLATLRGSAGFVKRQLVFENLLRFVGGEGITARPFWFYGPALLKETAPVGFFVLALLTFVLCRAQGRLKLRSQFAKLGDSPRLFLRVGLTWFLSGVFFLSLSTGKRSAYLVPLLPGFSLALGIWFVAAWEDEASTLSRFMARRGRMLAGSLLGCFALIAVLARPVLTIVMLRATLSPKAGIALGALRESLTEYQTLSWSFLGVCLVAGLWGLKKHVNGFRAGVLVTAAAGLAIPLFLFVNMGLIAKGKTHGYRQFAQELLTKLPQAERIHFVKTRRDESFDGLFFYYGRHVEMIDPKVRPTAPGVYVARRRWFEALKAESGPNIAAANIQELFEGGRRTDRYEQRLVVFRL